MSDSNKPNLSKNEEVDLIIFFNLIGNAVSNVFNFIGKIFKSIFSVIISIIKIVIEKWKIITVVVLIATISGYILEKKKRTVYSSDMLVRPYFESKYQFINNISYFNSLINSQDFETLKNIFNIPVEDIKYIKGFNIIPGPETENDQILEYQAFLKQIDSTRGNDISFKEFIDNRSIFSGDLFLVTAKAYKKDVFLSLEEGLNSSFTNKYSEKKKKKQDSLISIQRKNIFSNLKEVDSLQKVYIDVLKEESKTKAPTISLGENFSLSKEKSNNREFDLLNKKIKLRSELEKLEQQQIEEDVFFDVISSFQKVGNPINKFTEKYTIIFPLISFFILCLMFLLIKVINFAKNYKG